MSFNNFLAGPLPTPEQPPDDERPRVGDTYEKRSHTKTAVNAPRIMVVPLNVNNMVTATPLNFSGKYGFTGKNPRRMKERTLNNEWRKIS